PGCAPIDMGGAGVRRRCSGCAGDRPTLAGSCAGRGRGMDRRSFEPAERAPMKSDYSSLHGAIQRRIELRSTTSRYDSLCAVFHPRGHWNAADRRRSPRCFRPRPPPSPRKRGYRGALYNHYDWGGCGAFPISTSASMGAIQCMEMQGSGNRFGHGEVGRVGRLIRSLPPRTSSSPMSTHPSPHFFEQMAASSLRTRISSLAVATLCQLVFSVRSTLFWLFAPVNLMLIVSTVVLGSH